MRDPFPPLLDTAGVLIEVFAATPLQILETPVQRSPRPSFSAEPEAPPPPPPRTHRRNSSSSSNAVDI